MRSKDSTGKAREICDGVLRRTVPTEEEREETVSFSREIMKRLAKNCGDQALGPRFRSKDRSPRIPGSRATRT